MIAIELRTTADGLVGRYINRGDAPVALTFWWNRRMHVRDAAGAEVAPAAGPVLPCGVAEDWTVLAPGEAHERAEPMACTQPAGRTESIGWTYDLAPGAYRVVLVYEAPPAHGFTQSRPRDDAFAGRVESNEVTVIVEPPVKKQGLLSRLLG